MSETKDKNETIKKKTTADHSGHRKRLIKKLQMGALFDHEFLEVILFNGLPRRNTNDLAHRLLAEFGSVPNVLNTSIERLKRVDGIGENLAEYLFVYGATLRTFYDHANNTYPQVFDYDQFSSFVKKEYASLPNEVLDVYVLDAQGRICGRRRCDSANKYRVEVQSRWLSQVICDYQPAGLVLVHNHPHGDAKPSGMDDRTTEQCRRICKQNGVVLCDHFIYSPKGIYSYDLSKKMRARSGEENE